jgi:aryl-alcohol dehydrogenase-like predicted oxidoreductase
MRLGETADEAIAAAAASGIRVFDTARAYEGNEALLAGALRRCGGDTTARVVTKCGMGRPGGGWVPDGRAKAIRADCEASLAALAGIPIDLYLVHAPDPRTPWGTTMRALERLREEGMVRRLGVCNVNRRQLDEALAVASIAAVQVALSPFDDRALRSGVVERCAEHGIAVIAHSPLGGPGRAGRLAGNGALAGAASAIGATPAEAALAWLLDLSPMVVVIPGARRPQTVRSAAAAGRLRLTPGDRVALNGAFGRTMASTRRRAGSDGAEVVVVMGIPGSGKSRVAQSYAARGYVRLNRDERGGSLRDVAEALDSALASGARRVVLDNTYLTRAERSHVIERATRHGAASRCVWLSTPLAQAQVNMVRRLLARLGALPMPEELRELARREPGMLSPTSQMRTLRELEPPSADEGFAAVEEIAFERTPPSHPGRPGVFVAAAAVGRPGWEHALAETDREAPHLVFDWNPDGSTDVLAAAAVRLTAAVAGQVETALCPHPAGPPTCWCRPPLPGLALAFARVHDVDPARSTLVGTGPAHRSLAGALGARYAQRG